MAVPKSYREGSFGLGAGNLRTVFKVVLPSAVPGILSGIILATGRIVGETAALIYTAGSVAKMATKLTDSTRTLAVHMYLLSKEDFTLIKVMRQRLYFWYSWCLSTLHQTRLQARLLQIKPISMCQGFGIRALVCVSNIRQKHIRFCN